MDADDTTLTSAVKYDIDSEHEGTTNNNVRDLGLNCNHAASVIPFGAPPPAPEQDCSSPERRCDWI